MAAALIPVIAEVASFTPEILSALSVGKGLAEKYLPSAKRLANHIFNKEKRTSALSYLRKLGTQKGLTSFVQKDLPKAFNFVKSGKLLAGAQEVAGDIGKLGSAISQVPGNGSLGSSISMVGNKVGHNANYYHDQLSQYNGKAESLYNRIK